MKVDLEELKRKHSERVDSAFAQRIWNDAIDSCFPAIVAKLEAAQRLRDASKAWRNVSMGLVGAEKAATDLDEALAAFDKEQQ